MEVQQLNEWINNPELLGEESLIQLRSLLSRYPYFQTAWVIYLKNLFILNDPSFKDEVRKGALYIADLSLLFYFIEGDKFVVKKHTEEIAGTDGNENNSDRTLDLIDKFLSELSPSSEVSSSSSFQQMDIPVEVQSDYASILIQSDQCEKDDVETVPLHGQELIDNFIENSRNNLKEIEDNEFAGTDEPDAACDVPEVVNENVDEVDGEEEYFTETLAKIYVKQHRYDKALEIIKKLNLKYPKKNAYFADQMRFLEKLIINAKSK